MKDKLISHRTTETLPSGTTITKLHLTPEAKRGLSTNGVEIPAQPGELTIYDHRQRLSAAGIALHLGTVAAIVLAFLGVQPVVCAMIPSMAVSIPTTLWAWRDRQAIKRRRLARANAALREFSSKVSDPGTSLLACAHVPPRLHVEPPRSESDHDAHGGKYLEPFDRGRR